MSDPRLCRFLCIVLVCFGAVVPRARGVVDGVPIPNTDRRFDGVGLLFTATPWTTCGGWISGTCTLVGPNTVLLARHCLDIAPTEPLPDPSQRTYRVRFRRTTDGISENTLAPTGDQCHGVYQEIAIVLLVDAPSNLCDQVIGYLASAPVGIRPIIPELNNPPLTPIPTILAGWGYDGECYEGGTPWTLKYARGILPSNWSGNDYLSFSLCTLGTTAPCLSCPPVGGPFVNANLHDSGAPVLIEVPSTDPLDPTPELRLIGTVSSTGTGHRPSAWNDSGGVPALVQGASPPHLRPGDFNGDGVVDVEDILQYLNAFLSRRMDADANGDGVLQVADVLAFIVQWFAQ